MNYLAHIQLAHHSNTSMVGNFMGDFVKGSRLDHLPQDIIQGVLLHRSIDSFTDHHPVVRSLKRDFPTNIRRMSGVIIDVYFDHLLCIHWQQFNRLEMTQVLSEFYAELEANQVRLSERFNRVKQGLLTHQWLIDYQHRTGCMRALFHIEKRLNGRVEFAKYADDYLNTHHRVLEQAFLQFYPELIEHATTTLMMDMST